MMMLIRKTRFASLGLALALLSVIGCGDADKTVSGSVSFDGQAIDDGMVVFIPEAGEKRSKVAAQIVNGNYTVEPGRGLLAGKYRVEVTWMKKTGKKASTADGPELREEKAQALPAKFNKETTLTAEIPAPGNKLDFQLKSN